MCWGWKVLAAGGPLSHSCSHTLPLQQPWAVPESWHSPNPRLPPSHCSSRSLQALGSSPQVPTRSHDGSSQISSFLSQSHKRATEGERSVTQH